MAGRPRPFGSGWAELSPEAAGEMGPELAGHYRACLPVMRKALSEYSVYPVPPLFSRPGEKRLSRSDWSVLRYYLDKPGKLLRPYLAMLALQAAGRDPEEFRPLLWMLEVMESATVMLDDALDASPRRRGARAAQLVYGPRAAAAAMAVFHLCLGLPAHPSLRLGARERLRLHELMNSYYFRACRGHLSEPLLAAASSPVSMSSYLANVRDRIAILSFAGPLGAAAVCAGLSRARTAGFCAFGETLGAAYHLRGDILNLFPADPAWGKRTGDDLLAGKATFLTSAAMARLRREDSRAADSILSGKPSGGALQRAIHAARDCGAVEETEAAISSLNARALAILPELGLPREQRALFSRLPLYLSVRRKR